ncbi:MAG: acetyl-CoA carboxylase biotin carboxyl carrier protein [Mariniblastus sp.]
MTKHPGRSFSTQRSNPTTIRFSVSDSLFRRIAKRIICGAIMAKEKQDSVFEVSKIREFIELMKDHELSEIDLKHADQRIRLRRGGEQKIAYAPIPSAPAPVAAPAPAAAAAEAPADDPNIVYIESPTIGTFYSRPKPDAPDFVKVGDVITADTIVCIVEAMKMFNEIPAGVSGKIVECLVNNDDPVDNNKPLFKVAIN